MHDDEVSELRTAMFHGLLDQLPECSECRGRGCDQPYGIMTNGIATYRPESGACVVSWSHCPRKYETARELGNDLVTLDECCRWAIERGVHREKELSAGASQLLREYTRRKDQPAALREARAYEEQRRKQKASRR